MDTIAKNLTDEEVPTPAMLIGKSNASTLWHSNTIKGILQNRHYVGDLVQNKTATISVTTTKRREVPEEEMTVHENTHEPIISKETFQVVQRQLKQRTRTDKNTTSRMLGRELCINHWKQAKGLASIKRINTTSPSFFNRKSHVYKRRSASYSI
ncbi:hypothetical protein J2S17_005671 [Cytobacillus purgationiresistens]|uniref:Recombinase domain-containing protein n=2 Tax=Cytobacillus purgationiresistens TaxID=863449 RepID=A0ABU0AS86_9BACI|nr:hypothetical protein [Cytobacillus purgationiresistens]